MSCADVFKQPVFMAKWRRSRRLGSHIGSLGSVKRSLEISGNSRLWFVSRTPLLMLLDLSQTLASASFQVSSFMNTSWFNSKKEIRHSTSAIHSEACDSSLARSNTVKKWAILGRILHEVINYSSCVWCVGLHAHSNDYTCTTGACLECWLQWWLQRWGSQAMARIHL